MPGVYAFFQCVGEAVVAKGGRALAGLVPFGEHLYDIAADALSRWRAIRRSEDMHQALRQELQEAAQANQPQFEQRMRQIALDVAADQPAAVQEAVAGYLTLMPSRIRQTFSRPDDPSGKSVPAAFAPQRPEDLLPLLPSRPPRFKVGDVPPHGHNWVLVERLGVGGFGEVWKARHTVLTDRFAAFKFCLDPTAQERLLKHEAKIINQVMTGVNHPGIVKLQEVDFKTDAPWLQYEFVAGGDLDGWAARWPSDPTQRAKLATDTILTLARTVGHCHRLNPQVIHRDLKPSNILVAKNADGRTQLKVTDFGISDVVARQALDDANRATIWNASLSTPSLIRWAHTPLYASRQQKLGLAPLPADDIFALGVLWYQLLLGDFTSERPTGRWRNRLKTLGLPDAVLELIEACCDDDPKERPADAVAMADQITAA